MINIDYVTAYIVLKLVAKIFIQPNKNVFGKSRFNILLVVCMCILNIQSWAKVCTGVLEMQCWMQQYMVFKQCCIKQLFFNFHANSFWCCVWVSVLVSQCWEKFSEIFHHQTKEVRKHFQHWCFTLILNIHHKLFILWLNNILAIIEMMKIMDMQGRLWWEYLGWYLEFFGVFFKFSTMMKVFLFCIETMSLCFFTWFFNVILVSTKNVDVSGSFFASTCWELGFKTDLTLKIYKNP